MLLQKLREYTERLDLPPTLYSELAVRYIIDLDSQGHFLGMIDTSEPKPPRLKRGKPILVPEVRRTSDPRAFLLCDKADYVLGFVGDGAKPDRVEKAHGLFVELVRRCAASTGDPAVLAVMGFLENDPLGETILPQDFSPSDRITFRVDGVYPVAQRPVQAFWATENRTDQDAATTMPCVVCGEKMPVLKRLQGAIKGVPGGQTAGTSIISANAEAFESYGLEASLIAPTCADCGERFTKAANELLGSPESRTALAGAAFIYWTREDVGFNLLTYFVDPKPEAVGALLDALRRGGPLSPVDETRLYATVLSGSGARAVVRDWIDTTVGEVKTRLAQWFRRQAVVDGYGEEPRPLGLAALAGATVRQLSDVPRPTTRSLLHAALTGTPLPMDLLYQAVRRNRAEQTVTRPRAGLIKLVLCSRPENSQWEESMIQLDQENTNPAYRCGRLLSVLEEIQKRAIPSVNATIVDRFFGTASSAPASVFSRLIRGAQPHLAKIERDNRGAYFALQGRMQDILGGLPIQKQGTQHTGFPSTLNLMDQGLFALGYYHQRAFDRAQAIEASARRRAAQNGGDDDSPDEPAI